MGQFRSNPISDKRVQVIGIVALQRTSALASGNDRVNFQTDQAACVRSRIRVTLVDKRVDTLSSRKELKL